MLCDRCTCVMYVDKQKERARKMRKTAVTFDFVEAIRNQRRIQIQHLAVIPFVEI